MIERTAILFVFSMFSALATAQLENQLSTSQSGYSLETLAEPIFGSAEVVVETMKLNNWLNANYETLEPDQFKGLR